MIKIQSILAYKIGTILHDETTKETFEVISCDRIRLLDSKVNYGLTLKEIKK